MTSQDYVELRECDFLILTSHHQNMIRHLLSGGPLRTCGEGLKQPPVLTVAETAGRERDSRRCRAASYSTLSIINSLLLFTLEL